MAFKLKYIDGLTTPTSPALFLGGRVHAGLELWYRHRQLGITLDTADVTKSIEEGWGRAAEDDGMVFKDSDQEQTLRTQTGRLIEAYIAHVPADEPKPLAVEATMEAPLVVKPANALLASGG